VFNYALCHEDIYIEEWRYSFIILDLGTRWRWVVSLTPQPLYPPPTGETALGIHWIGRWVGSWAGLDPVEKRTSCPCREWNPRPSSPYPVAMLLYRLSYSVHMSPMRTIFWTHRILPDLIPPNSTWWRTNRTELLMLFSPILSFLPLFQVQTLSSALFLEHPQPDAKLWSLIKITDVSHQRTACIFRVVG
jgi:hypothetical protein